MSLCVRSFLFSNAQKKKGNANGTAYFGAFLNSVVHLLMYTHYLLASLGVNNPFKALLTKIQMLQFGMCLLHAVVVVFFERVLPARLAYLQLAYHTVMLILFADFMRKTYPAGGAKKGGQSARSTRTVKKE